MLSDLNSQTFPFEDSSFDFVICKDVFEHLLNPELVISEIHRVLKPKGLFLFHVPNHFTLVGRIRFLFFNNIDTYSFFGGCSRFTLPHIRFYEQYDTIAKFKEYGFMPILNLSYVFILFPRLFRRKFMRPITMYLSNYHANDFCAGYTYLFRKQ